MYNYKIIYKVLTVAELVEPFEHNGYQFGQYTPSYWSDDCWVVSRDVNAKNMPEALRVFVDGMIPIVEQCSYISQCAFRHNLGSYMVYRLDKNPEKIVFLHYVKNSGHVGLHFDETERNQLPKTNVVDHPKGFLYIMEAANCTTYYSRLMMLLSATEAFAGEVKVNGTKRTDKVKMIEILGDELYNKLYTYGEGLRHKLVHGVFESHGDYAGLIDVLYGKLRHYLNARYDVLITENVVDPMRNFNDGYQYANISESFRGEPVFDLARIEREFIHDDPDRLQNVHSVFDGKVIRLPVDY